MHLNFWVNYHHIIIERQRSYARWIMLAAMAHVVGGKLSRRRQ
ncbi:hypothetical protein [Sulfuricurvum sp.]